MNEDVTDNENGNENNGTREGFAVQWDEALPERKRFYASDPFGNRIEFMEAGQGFSQK